MRICSPIISIDEIESERIVDVTPVPVEWYVVFDHAISTVLSSSERSRMISPSPSVPRYTASEVACMEENGACEGFVLQRS
ncbi:MAG TPA: hypothetical protein HA247_04130 [Candidatus Thalassarchaeaceae archaeon]|nr:MAG TPA: hypothetical protein D7H98_04170 [Candidatus Poseidoniales archaeon]HII90185.1 hypothetical protein [Candidatus Thalassarchaeaceae archaeon]